MAAGALMLTEAGGTITALDGAPFDVRQGQLMASNGLLHPALLDVVQRLACRASGDPRETDLRGGQPSPDTAEILAVFRLASLASFLLC